LEAMIREHGPPVVLHAPWSSPAPSTLTTAPGV